MSTGKSGAGVPPASEVARASRPLQGDLGFHLLIQSGRDARATPDVRPEQVILRALLQAAPDVVSGEALARELGVSRVSVWQHMEKLREQGVVFESLHSKGYRLAPHSQGLSPALIEALRNAECETSATPAANSAFTSLHLLDEVDSTNDEAARRLTAGEAAPLVVMARRQTKGRGRFGRVWHSGVAGNLYCSFGFRPRVEPARMQPFSLWMGVNICEFVADFCRIAPGPAGAAKIGIKWPNDLLLDGRKAGGILTEARMDADQIRDLVLGLGLNLQPPPEGWPPEIAARAVSISEHANVPVEINRFALALVARVLEAYEQFVADAHRDTFADLWNKHDLLRGRPVAVLQGDTRTPGTAMGVDDEGCLLVRTPMGGIERFRAGEVTLEKSQKCEIP